MIRSSSVLFWFGLVIIASIALYRTSDRVQELNHQLSIVNAAIESEQQSIHVLKAEWVYLANPDRVKMLAQKHLALRQTSPQQIASLEGFTEILPTRHESQTSVAVTTTPIVNVHTSLAALSPSQHFASTHAKPANIHVASANTGHIADHMLMQHSASAQQVSLDPIGSLIGQINAHP